jgi:hypothetical protein
MRGLLATDAPRPTVVVTSAGYPGPIAVSCPARFSSHPRLETTSVPHGDPSGYGAGVGSGDSGTFRKGRHECLDVLEDFAGIADD